MVSSTISFVCLKDWDSNMSLPLDKKLDVMALVPWGVIGLMIIIGGLSALIYGLPFETKTDALHTDAQLSTLTVAVAKTADQVNILATNQAVMQEALRNISNQTTELEDLRKMVEQQAIHIEGLEADEKANDSARLARHARSG